MIKSKMKWLIGGLTLIVFLAGGLFYFIATAPTDESIRQLQADADKLRRQGKYDRAEEYYRKSIKQSDQKYGENNIAAASAYTGLGALFTQKKDHAKAADNLLLAADIYQHSAGNAIYPEKLFALKLAATLSLEKTRDYKKADSIYNFVEKHLNGLPPELQFKYYLYRGRSYYNRHEFKRASQLLQKAYDTSCPQTLEEKAEIYEYLGNSYLRMNQFNKSQFYYTKLLSINQNKFGKNSPETAVFHLLLATAFCLNKKYSNARINYLKVINILESEKNSNEYLIPAYFALGKILVKQDKKTAVKYWKKAYALQKQMPSSIYVSQIELEKLINRYDK
jgi:tetratricopeptide (TPR) repeat protein